MKKKKSKKIHGHGGGLSKGHLLVGVAKGRWRVGRLLRLRVVLVRLGGVKPVDVVGAAAGASKAKKL